MEMLLGFLSANMASILLVVVAVVAMGYLWQKGYKSNVCLYILTLIGKAEIEFSHGDNQAKLESVIDGVYAKFPKLIKFFYTKEDLIKLINKIVTDTKEWLQNQTKVGE